MPNKRSTSKWLYNVAFQSAKKNYHLSEARCWASLKAKLPPTGTQQDLFDRASIEDVGRSLDQDPFLGAQNWSESFQSPKMCIAPALDSY